MAPGVPFRNRALIVSAADTHAVSVMPCRSSEKLARAKSPSAAPGTATVVVTPVPAAKAGGSQVTLACSNRSATTATRCRSAGTRAAVLAAAFTGGTTRVTFDGRTVEYRSLDELRRALSVLHAAENAAARRPSISLASFSRG